ncbi:hypothetical protein [Xanthocytophaga flava]|uniref:hypothetical protein n=1 Tax=Xanthocytophaga flava TaxID=3048013 RepID=UPI0028D3588F|nr:hypothetical protein [Xanthocytophaga flavus]MDJ1470615.1 hypothetical protein [Xanthocytophaga flavus]
MTKQLFVLIFSFLTVLTSCQGQSSQNATNTSTYSLPIDTAFIPTDSTQFYFPLEIFRDTSLYVGHDTLTDSWYSKHLFAMREPVIYANKSQKEMYRFTWLRSFHNPVAIRIEKNGDTYRLYWKLCDGAGGYRPGKLTISKQKTINKATWEMFQTHMHQIDFWNMKTNETELLGSDGSQWVLEGKTTTQYHVVDRWTPNKDSKYYTCCNFLIGLTDLKIKKDDKY